MADYDTRERITDQSQEHIDEVLNGIERQQEVILLGIQSRSCELRLHLFELFLILAGSVAVIGDLHHTEKKMQSLEERVRTLEGELQNMRENERREKKHEREEDFERLQAPILL